MTLTISSETNCLTYSAVSISRSHYVTFRLDECVIVQTHECLCLLFCFDGAVTQISLCLGKKESIILPVKYPMFQHVTRVKSSSDFILHI